MSQQDPLNEHRSKRVDELISDAQHTRREGETIAMFSRQATATLAAIVRELKESHDLDLAAVLDEARRNHTL